MPHQSAPAPSVRERFIFRAIICIGSLRSENGNARLHNQLMSLDDGGPGTCVRSICAGRPHSIGSDRNLSDGEQVGGRYRERKRKLKFRFHPMFRQFGPRARAPRDGGGACASLEVRWQSQRRCLGCRARPPISCQTPGGGKMQIATRGRPIAAAPSDHQCRRSRATSLASKTYPCKTYP